VRLPRLHFDVKFPILVLMPGQLWVACRGRLLRLQLARSRPLLRGLGIDRGAARPAVP
jgi:hypothetical protein